MSCSSLLKTQFVCCPKWLRETAVLLVNSVFPLVLKEDTIYSRRCLQSLTTVFSIESSELTGEDFLRSVVWELCFTKLERGISSSQSADGTFGEIRRGGTSHPSIQPADQIQEEKRSSLFDSSMLTDHEAWKVELYRLLTTFSSPVDPSEATRPDYQAMKTDLLRAYQRAYQRWNRFNFLLPSSFDLLLTKSLLPGSCANFIHSPSQTW